MWRPGATFRGRWRGGIPASMGTNDNEDVRTLRPDVLALVRRGNITTEETKGLCCNSWGWRAVRLAMTNEALAEVARHTIANSTRQRHPEVTTTYDECAIHLLLLAAMTDEALLDVLGVESLRAAHMPEWEDEEHSYPPRLTAVAWDAVWVRIRNALARLAGHEAKRVSS